MSDRKRREAIERDEAYIPELPHRAAPEDLVVPVEADKRERPPLDEKLNLERMLGEGGGSAPLQDAPESGGDLRFREKKRER